MSLKSDPKTQEYRGYEAPSQLFLNIYVPERVLQ